MLKRLCLALFSLLLALVLGEGLARGFWWSRGEPYVAAHTREGLARNLAAAEGALIPGAARQLEKPGNVFLHPYFGWEVASCLDRMDQLARHYRAGARPDAYVIVVVGGSVSGLFADGKVGAPELLAAEIGADPRLAGRKVRVVAQGRGAFKQPQQLFVVTWLLALGVMPDAVINIDGFNELALANQNRDFDTHPLFPSFPQWGPRLRPTQSLAQPEADRATLARLETVAVSRAGISRRFYLSAILGPWALSRSTAALERWQSASGAMLESLRGDKGRPETPRLLGPTFHGGETEALDMAIATWRDSTLDLEALCRRRGIAYLHVLQPTLLDQGSKPLTEDEVRNGTAIAAWRRAIAYGYDKMRAEGARLREEGFPFFDASMVFADVGETLYYDPCHFDVEGNRILALAIASAYRERVLAQ